MLFVRVGLTASPKLSGTAQSAGKQRRRNFLSPQRWWADNVAETFWNHKGGRLAPSPKLSGTAKVVG